MPVKSYIVTPVKGELQILIRHVLSITGCEVMVAKNRNVLVVISDADNEKMDEQIHDQLLSIPSLEHLTLVSGFGD